MQRNSVNSSIEQTLSNMHPYFLAIDDLSRGELFEHYLTQFYSISDDKKVMILKENNTNQYYIAFYNKHGVAEFFKQYEKVASPVREMCNYSFMQLSAENYQQLGQSDFQNHTKNFKLMTANPAFERELTKLILASGGATCYLSPKPAKHRFFYQPEPLIDHAQPEGIDHSQPTRGIEL